MTSRNAASAGPLSVPRFAGGHVLRVDPRFRWRCADTSHDAAPAAVWRCSLGRGVCDGRRGSEGEVMPRLARSAPGCRLRIQPKVGEDLLDHLPLQDGGDDLEFPGGAVRAVLHVDVNTRLSSRAQLMRPGRAWTVSISLSATAADSAVGSASARAFGTTSGRNLALGGSTPLNRMRCRRNQRRQPLHELQRRHHQVRRPVAPRRLELQLHLPGSVELHPLVR